jgi:Flp pilus assembly protein TadB
LKEGAARQKSMQSAPGILMKAVWQQRIALACALTVAVVLIGIFHAPPVAVLLGCVLALGLLVGRAYRQLDKNQT